MGTARSVLDRPADRSTPPPNAPALGLGSRQFRPASCTPTDEILVTTGKKGRASCRRMGSLSFLVDRWDGSSLSPNRLSSSQRVGPGRVTNRGLSGCPNGGDTHPRRLLYQNPWVDLTDEASTVRTRPRRTLPTGPAAGPEGFFLTCRLLRVASATKTRRVRLSATIGQVVLDPKVRMRTPANGANYTAQSPGRTPGRRRRGLRPDQSAPSTTHHFDFLESR